MKYFVLVENGTNRICGAYALGEGVTYALGEGVIVRDVPGQTLQEIDEAAWRATLDLDRKTTKAVWSPADKTVRIVEKEESVLSDQAWAELRKERDRLLAETDHTQIPDFPKKALYTAYRQELRDLPAKTTDPFNPPWPALTAEAKAYLKG